VSTLKIRLQGILSGVVDKKSRIARAIHYLLFKVICKPSGARGGKETSLAHIRDVFIDVVGQPAVEPRLSAGFKGDGQFPLCIIRTSGTIEVRRSL
jgi:hypothetical protein